MPITWLIFHDFGMIILVLVKKKKNPIQLRLKLLKKNQINGFAKKCSTSITIEILEETNNSS